MAPVLMQCRQHVGPSVKCERSVSARVSTQRCILHRIGRQHRGQYIPSTTVVVLRAQPLRYSTCCPDDATAAAAAATATSTVVGTTGDEGGAKAGTNDRSMRCRRCMSRGGRRRSHFWKFAMLNLDQSFSFSTFTASYRVLCPGRYRHRHLGVGSTEPSQNVGTLH